MMGSKGVTYVQLDLFASQSFGAAGGRVYRLCRPRRLNGVVLAKAVGIAYLQCREQLVRLAGDATMARNDVGKPKADFQGFVNINLDDVDKARLTEEDMPGFEWLWEWVGGMTHSGHKFSFSWDDYSQAQQIAVFCWDPASPNHGHALSARHPDLDTALLTLWYKHEVKCGREWGQPNRPAPPSWG